MQELDSTPSTADNYLDGARMQLNFSLQPTGDEKRQMLELAIANAEAQGRGDVAQMLRSWFSNHVSSARESQYHNN